MFSQVANTIEHIRVLCVTGRKDAVYLWRAFTITSGSLLPALWLPCFHWLVLFLLFGLTK